LYAIHPPSPPRLEKNQRRRHRRIERLDSRLHRDGQSQAGAGEKGGGEAGALGAHGEDEGAVEAGLIEILAAARD
jgi:hypothetical protein